MGEKYDELYEEALKDLKLPDEEFNKIEEDILPEVIDDMSDLDIHEWEIEEINLEEPEEINTLNSPEEIKDIPIEELEEVKEVTIEETNDTPSMEMSKPVKFNSSLETIDEELSQIEESPAIEVKFPNISENLKTVIKEEVDSELDNMILNIEDDIETSTEDEKIQEEVKQIKKEYDSLSKIKLNNEPKRDDIELEKEEIIEMPLEEPTQNETIEEEFTQNETIEEKGTEPMESSFKTEKEEVLGFQNTPKLVQVEMKNYEKIELDEMDDKGEESIKNLFSGIEKVAKTINKTIPLSVRIQKLLEKELIKTGNISIRLDRSYGVDLSDGDIDRLNKLGIETKIVSDTLVARYIVIPNSFNKFRIAKLERVNNMYLKKLEGITQGSPVTLNLNASREGVKDLELPLLTVNEERLIYKMLESSFDVETTGKEFIVTIKYEV